MRLKNSPDHYGMVSKSLHWIIALLMIGLIWLGWYMVDLTYYDPWYYDSLTLHRAFGILVLALGVIKLGWVVYSRPPAYADTLKAWERGAARVTHGIFYSAMVAIPITGYFISTSKGDPVSFFGWFDIPAFFSVGNTLRDFAIALHYYLAYGIAFLIVIHALAALKHQFIDKDGTLKKML
jgi:cytochrome b561